MFFPLTIYVENTNVSVLEAYFGSYQSMMELFYKNSYWLTTFSKKLHIDACLGSIYASEHCIEFRKN